MAPPRPAPQPGARHHRHAAPLLGLLLLLTAAVALPHAAATKPPPFDTEALVSRLAAKAAGPVTAKLADEAAIGLADAHPSAPLMPAQLADWKKFTTDLRCGAGLGVCPPGFCCGPSGLCGQTREACGTACQLHYSGPGAACTANLPQPLVSTDPVTGKTVGSLPPVPKGGVCGVYVGACAEPGECCSQFGICTPSKYFCSIPACVRAASPHSPTCQAVWDRVKPVQRKYKLVATWGWANPDGVRREVILLNGKFQGPTLRGNVGDRIIVEFYNLLDEPSSIHWHGMRQVGTSLSDGVPPVTQREIGAATGNQSRLGGHGNETAPTFTYDFILDSPGSFWYHSHSGVQYMDGLRGALVVTDPYALDPYSENAVTHSPILFATDWNWNRTSVLLPYVERGFGGNPALNNITLSNSVLVNGWGKTRVCEADNSCRVPVIRGAPSRCDAPTMRMRLINGAGSDPVNITLFPTDGSRLETYLLGMDGVRLNPTNVTDRSVYLVAGQRLGVVPCTGGGQPASSEPIWVRTNLVPGGNTLATTWSLLDLDERYPTDETESILWEDAPPLPAGLEVAVADAAESAKAVVTIPPQPIVPPLGDLVPPKPTKTVIFTVGTTTKTNGSQYANQFTINGVSLQPPDDGPSLIEHIYGSGYQTPVPYTPVPTGAGWNVYDNKMGDVVEIVIKNPNKKGGGAPHPFHTHGHWMLVTSVNGQATEGFNPAPGNANPVLLARDVIAVAPNTTMTALYIVDNPSAWIVHCHIDWHVIKGLGWIFRDGI